MGAISSLGSTLTNIVKSVGNGTKSLTNFLTNDVGGVLRDVGAATGDPVLAKLGIGLHEAQDRSQTIKDIESNAPKAVAAYLGGEYLYGALGGGTAGAGAGTAGAGAASAGTGGTAAAGAGATAAAGATDIIAGSSAASTAAGLAGQSAQTSGILAEIASVITEVEQAINGFIKPITDTVNSINDGIIKPIVGPIQTIMQEQASLRDFIKGDLHSGIMGILRLPGDVADALTSVDASFSRAIQQLTATQGKAFNDGLETFGPSLGSEGSTKVAASISSALPGEAGKWSPPPRLSIMDTADVASLIKSAEDTIATMSSSDHWYVRLWLGLLTTMESGGLILAQHRAVADACEKAGRRDFPEADLDAGTLLRGYTRGELTREQVVDELLSAGINSSRADVMLALARVLPGLADLLDWAHRGLLTADELKASLGVLGYADEDVTRYIQANITLPDSGEALRWWQRGIISEELLGTLLTAHGYDPQLIDAIKQGAFILPQLADLMALYDRELALSENAGTNLAADQVPAPFVAEARRLGVSAADASVLWANHLQLLPPGLAVSSYFRGYIDRAQLYAFTRAAGFTREMTDMLVDASRPQLPYRTIPALVKAGVLDQAEAIGELKALGFTDIATDRLLRLALASGKTTGTATATTIHKDVQETTMQLYDAGTLTREQADAALQAAGLEPDAAVAMLNLADVKNTAAIHRTEVETVVAQVQAGALSVDQANAALATFGLNDREQAQATTKMNTAARRRTKLPAEGTLLAMLRRGILDEADTETYLVALGYSQDWAGRLVALEQAEHGQAPKQ